MKEKKPSNKLENLSSTPDSRAKRLKIARSITGLTLSNFCEDSGIAPDTIISWERPRHGGLTKKGAEKVVKRLKTLEILCSLSWLMEGKGLSPVHIEQKLYPVDSVEDEALLFSQDQDIFKKYTNFVSLIIIDNDMSPVFLKGDFLGGVEVKSYDEAVSLPSIIEFSSKKKLVGILKKNEAEGVYSLYGFTGSDDGLEISANDIESVAPIIILRRKVNNS